MAYKEKVLDHYNNPRNVGSMDKSLKNIGTGMVGAPSCGDVMKLQIEVENGIIKDAKFKAFGCASAIASSSLATEWLKNKTIDQALTIKNRDIALELDLPPVKYHCSVLAEDAIKTAIADYQSKNSATQSSEKNEESGDLEIRITQQHHVDNHGITITDKALEKIGKILKNDGGKIAIRFMAKDGGCSGKKYDIKLDEKLDANHINLSWKINIGTAIKHILIDEDSLELFKNVEIGYEENELGEKFVFKNPNATNYCGCGKSFS